MLVKSISYLRRGEPMPALLWQGDNHELAEIKWSHYKAQADAARSAGQLEYAIDGEITRIVEVKRNGA